MSTPPLFCASSLDDLKVDCGSAQSCQNGPCPKGMFCFPYLDCEETGVEDGVPEFSMEDGASASSTGGIPTYSPTTLTWAPTTVEQQQSMGTYAPTEAYGDGGGGWGGDSTGSPSAEPQQQQQKEEEEEEVQEQQQQQDEEEEQKHKMPQQPQQQQADESLCPGLLTGWRAANGCKDYYRCFNGVPGPVHTCNSGLWFDVANRYCRIASQVDGGTCEGSSSSSQTTSQPQQGGGADEAAQTAQKQEESQADVGGDDQVDSSGGAEPAETTAQHHEQQHDGPGSMCRIPDGWHTTEGCTEYYQCADGLPDKIYTCPPGLLFDVLRSVCEGASGVDVSSCRGPPLRPEEAQYYCPEDYTGLKIQSSCTEYYECDGGSMTPVKTCRPGLKYDRNTHRCINARDVDGQCFGPRLQSQQAAADLCPITNGWVAHSDCKAYHECIDGMPDRIYSCQGSNKYDRVRNQCNALGVDGDCRGPPITEYEKRQQAQEDNARLCPIQNGWVAHTGCESYHKCGDGKPGAIYGCQGSKRYDRLRNQCTTLGVDDNCRGPPLTESEKKQLQSSQQSAGGGSGGGQSSVASPCPPSFEGYGTSSDCRSYFTCSNGSMSSPSRSCPDGTRFDKTTRRCRAESSVNDYCYGPPEGSPDERAKEVCEMGNEDGWKTLDGCRRYFMCQSGGMVDSVHECGADLLFDEDRGMCNFADRAVCSSGAGPAGGYSDGGGGGVPPLGGGGGEDDGNPWADVLAPSPRPTTVSQVGARPGKIPPWMRLEFSSGAAAGRLESSVASSASLVLLVIALLR